MTVVRLILSVAATAGLLVVGQTPEPFLEKPYLQLGNTAELEKSESLMLLWHTNDESADWRVEVRTSKDRQWRATDAPIAQSVNVPGIAKHRVYRARLSGLMPGEEFRYRVLKQGTQVFEASGRARKSAKQAQRFVLFGDCAQNTPSQRSVAYQVSLVQPDFIFIPGDIVYTAGRISEYREKFFPIYNADSASNEAGAPLLRSIPFIAAPGNHDTALRNFERFPDALAYFLYWDQPLNGPPNTELVVNSKDDAAKAAFLEGAKPRYPVMANFSFDYGNAHWTVLDSNPYMDWNSTALRDWVAADLARAKHATWRFVAFHHPGFNSSKSHFTDQWMRLLAPVFEQGKVDIVFSGHVHNYQRTYPLTFLPKPQPDGAMKGAKGEVAGDWSLDKEFADGASAKPRGVIYIVTGAGGAALYDPDQTTKPDGWQPFTTKYQAQVHSFSVVNIDGSKLSFRQVSESGTELDAFQLSK